MPLASFTLFFVFFPSFHFLARIFVVYSYSTWEMNPRLNGFLIFKGQQHAARIEFNKLYAEEIFLASIFFKNYLFFHEQILFDV